MAGLPMSCALHGEGNDHACWADESDWKDEHQTRPISKARLRPARSERVLRMYSFLRYITVRRVERNDSKMVAAQSSAGGAPMNSGVKKFGSMYEFYRRDRMREI